MKQVQIAILNEASTDPVGMMRFLAMLTQRGHKVSDVNSLCALYDKAMLNETIPAHTLVRLPHGSIKRHTPITVAVVGASRRFLAQIRTHSVGIDFMSASLQYSDYSGAADFYVPYEYLGTSFASAYLEKCKEDLRFYESLIRSGINNDTAGYSMPQALRNILIITANHEAWLNLIRVRACNRNTNETQYVVAKIWETLYEKSFDGDEYFAYAGPDCMFGRCREGHMSCGKPVANTVMGVLTNPATVFIKERWPLLYADNN